MKGRPSMTDAYEPSVLNRFYEAVARLPGGGWWIYPLLFAAEIASSRPSSCRSSCS
jgi:hypothetical protein